MASIKAIVAAATSYNFILSAKTEGVTLGGPLGNIVVWEDGSTEEPTSEPGRSTTPYRTGPAPQLEFARREAVRWLGL